MSRSYRKTPITGFAIADSEKWFKQKESRARRQAETQLCRSLELDPEMDDYLPDREFKSAFGPKDGKCHHWPFDWAQDDSDIRRIMNK